MQFSPLRHRLLQPLEGQGQIEVMLKFVFLDYLLVLCKQHFVVAVFVFVFLYSINPLWEIKFPSCYSFYHSINNLRCVTVIPQCNAVNEVSMKLH